MVGPAGLAECVASIVDHYATLAVALAHDPRRRVHLHARLLRARAEAPLFNAINTARILESAFTTMLAQRRMARKESFEVAANMEDA